MLILTRKIHEAIMIGTNVRIEIIDLDNHTVRLGIDAPRIISVHREEVYQRIKHRVSNRYLLKPTSTPIKKSCHLGL